MVEQEYYKKLDVDGGSDDGLNQLVKVFMSIQALDNINSFSLS